MDHTPPITWDDIAGLDFVKKTIKEIVIWPMLRPDIFKGLRGPPKGLLLFGPPGNSDYLCLKINFFILNVHRNWKDFNRYLRLLKFI